MATNTSYILQQMPQDFKIICAHFEMLCINKLVCIKVAKSRARKISKTHSKRNFFWRQFCSYIFLRKTKSKKKKFFFPVPYGSWRQFKLASRTSAIYLDLEIILKTLYFVWCYHRNSSIWNNKQICSNKQNVRTCSGWTKCQENIG